MSEQISTNKNYSLRFISHIDKQLIRGFDFIQQWFLSQNFDQVNSFHYQIKAKKEVQKFINNVAPGALTEKVALENQIDINHNFKAVQKIYSKIITEPQNILLVQLEAARNQSFCLNLLFRRIFNTGKNVLVSSMPHNVRSQLMAIPDLEFKTIPVEITENYDLKKELLERSKRPKGMQSAVREISDFSFIPSNLKKKINQVLHGAMPYFSEAEVINILLLSDTFNRYSSMLKNFEEDLHNRRISLSALAKIFSELVEDISLKTLKKEFSDYINKKKTTESFSNSSELFLSIYSYISSLNQTRKNFLPGIPSLADFLLKFRELFILQRSQLDPPIWKQCLYINYQKYTTKQDIEENRKTLETLRDNIISNIDNYNESNANKLEDLYLAHNTYSLLFGSKINIINLAMSADEEKIALNFHANAFGVKISETEAQSLKINIPSKVLEETEHLIFSPNILATAYEGFIIELLDKKVEKLLNSGLEKLKEKFSDNLFEIIYEKIVLKYSLPVSRNQLAHRLREKHMLRNPVTLGWIPSEIESKINYNSDNQVTHENEISVLNFFSKKDFNKKYESSSSEFQEFFDFIQREYQHSTTGNFFKKIKAEGIFNFNGSKLKKLFNKTDLSKEYQKIVRICCNRIWDNILNEALDNKIIIRIPLKYTAYLWLNNLFKVKNNEHEITIHLVATSVNDPEKLTGISKLFSQLFIEEVEDDKIPSKRRMALITQKLTELYRLDFIKYSRLIFLDRLLYQKKDGNPGPEIRPEELKIFLTNQEKMIVGETKNLDLSPFFDSSSSGISKNTSIPEFFQNLEYIVNIDKEVNKTKNNSIKILVLLNKFSQKTKETKEWIYFYKLLKGFIKIISLPVSKLDNKILDYLEKISTQLKLKITRNKNNQNSFISRLVRIWNFRNPENKEAMEFYSPFTGGYYDKKSNTILKIGIAREKFLELEKIKALIFFPEGFKKFQIQHLIYFSQVFKTLPFNLDIYLNISSLNEDQIENISRYLHPGCFFDIDKIADLG